MGISGGPKNIDMLYSVDAIRNDFANLHIEQLTTETVVLSEGAGHQGEAEVIRFVGLKSHHE